MNDIDTEYSKQIEALLTANQWKRFSQAIRVLKYNSPGEYLRLFYEDETKFLESNKHYLRSTFIIRKQQLIAGIQFPITDWRPRFIREIIFFRSQKIFNELHKELARQEFLDFNNTVYDLEIKLTRYRRLSNYLIQNGFTYNFYLNDMELSLKERLLMEDKFAVARELQDKSPLFYYLNKPLKLNRFAKFLVAEQIINGQESFVCLFHRDDKRVNFKSKTIWYGDIIALIFTLKSLMVYGILKDEYQLAKKLSESFLDRNGEEIANTMIHQLVKEYQFNKINNKRDLDNWVENNRNKYIEKIYRELRKIYFNDLDLL